MRQHSEILAQRGPRLPISAVTFDQRTLKSA
jgi:hypothetical protein